MKVFEGSAVRSLAGLACLLCWIGLAGSAYAQQNPSSGTDLEVLHVRPTPGAPPPASVYMIGDAGANITVQFGSQGVVVVDTGSGKANDRVLAEIRKLTDQPIREIINTSADADHVGGNEALSQAGKSLYLVQPNTTAVGNLAIGQLISSGAGATILAHDNVLTRMSAMGPDKKPLYPEEAWPSYSYPSVNRFQDKQYHLYLNGEAIQVLHQPAAHTDGDSIVFFRRSDVLAVGDILNMESFPVVDLAKGGSIQGELDALNRVIDMAIPELPLVWEEGGTLVIPGHGRICEQPDVVEYRDMVTIIRDVIQDQIKKGKTLEQIKAADPTKDYRPRYGADSGPWTTDMFVEAVYRSLTDSKNPQVTSSAKN